MKKPIFTNKQRCSWYAPELEVAKLKFKRDFEKTEMFKTFCGIVNWLNKKLK